MYTEKLTEQILAAIADRASDRAKLLLTQLDMAYPPSESRALIRKAVLNTLGNYGVLSDIKIVLSFYISSKGDLGSKNER